jgi:outer membrane protein OmpA-like peptidoglycan-associated protein
MLSNREKQLQNQKDFEGYLALDYLKYAKLQKENYDWNSSEHFANKGLRLYKGKHVYPEAPEVWRINKKESQELNIARNRLMIVFENAYTRKTRPSDLADVTFLYDCWVERRAEEMSYGEIANCKDQFYIKLEELEGYLLYEQQRVQTVDLSKKEPEKEKEIQIVKNEPFEIYFDFDSYKLNTEGVKKVIKILKYLESLNGDYSITIEGHADRVGKKLYNDMLARKRALTIKSRLIKNGVPEEAIEMKTYGEANPKIITKDDMQAQVNRRVSIYVNKGNNNISTVPLPLE